VGPNAPHIPRTSCPWATSGSSGSSANWVQLPVPNGVQLGCPGQSLPVPSTSSGVITRGSGKQLSPVDPVVPVVPAFGKQVVFRNAYPASGAKSSSAGVWSSRKTRNPSVRESSPTDNSSSPRSASGTAISVVPSAADTPSGRSGSLGTPKIEHWSGPPNPGANENEPQSFREAAYTLTPIWATSTRKSAGPSQAD
jgi:hypothetical protein